MRLVIVAGAGASTYLGKEEALPLMDGWAHALRAELNLREEGLADSIGLKEGISGEDFETRLGELFRWRDLRGLNARFRSLGSDPLGADEPSVLDAESREKRRMSEIMDAINTTLFRLFGAVAIDEAKAVDAYDGLLEVLGRPKDLVMVTTNYDPAIELALSGLGMRPETGFERTPGKPPHLEPEGMVERLREIPGTVPVLHLHGAVGWYEKKGQVLEHHQHLPFEHSNGRPVVLYPDPEKDPTRDSLVHALWDEFKAALRDATHVLVIGHSLHDPALVGRLAEASMSANVAIGLLGLPGPQGDKLVVDDLTRKRIQALFPRLSAHPSMRFGPRSIAHLTHVGNWFAETMKIGGIRSANAFGEKG
jgi:hypothetical protein